jgi:hypothetical protein
MTAKYTSTWLLSEGMMAATTGEIAGRRLAQDLKMLATQMQKVGVQPDWNSLIVTIQAEEDFGSVSLTMRTALHGKAEGD